MSTSLPLNTDLTSTVSELVDTGKIFRGGGIQKKKFIVKFTDGYSAEYCPPAEQALSFKQGDDVVFQIKFRDNRGDTIEVISTKQANGANTPALKPPPLLSQSSMMGHPAAISLSVAKDMAIRDNWTWEEMLKKADEAMQWLIARKDLDQYNF